MFAIETIQFGHRPLECRDLLLTDNLPSYYGHDVGVDIPVGSATSANDANKFPMIKFKDVNPFARTAQAAYLSSLVLDWIFSNHQNVDLERQHAEVMYLSQIVQAFIISNMTQGEQEKSLPWATACGANFLAQRSVFTHLLWFSIFSG
jgi:hypothetical protein